MADFVDFNHGLRSIGERTDPDGEPVSDLSAREDGLINGILGEGVLTPDDGWRVAADGTMTVRVGSGGAYDDVAVVGSLQAQQPPYLVRSNQAEVAVQLDASGSQTRVDQLFLVVQDDVWDGSGRALARIGYRKGTAGQGAPGPDASWHAFMLLATIQVGAAVDGVVQADVVDERATANLSAALRERVVGDRSPVGHTHAAGDVTEGTLADARIPNLAASKVTSGTFPVARGGTGRSSVTSGRYLRGAGAGALEERTPDQVRADIGAAAETVTTLGNVNHYDDERVDSHTGTSFTRIKQVRVPTAGALRLLVVTRHTSTSGYSEFQIRRGSTVLATISTEEAQGGEVERTVDTSGWSPGDTLSIWGRRAAGSGGTSEVRRLRIRASQTPPTFVSDMP